MRIEGLGGPVLEKHGVKLVDAPASKLVGLLSSRELDACEFATPAMDEAAGLHKVVPKLIYHYPGWHQPSAVFEFLVNQNVWKSLTQQQQALLTAASHNASTSFTESLLAKNQIVLERMISEHSVKMHKFPDSLLQALKKDSEKVLAEHCAGDKFSLEVMESYLKFLKQMEKWGPMSSAAMWQWRK
jgi:TRAP-type mannitol/chloroaromatic compound transport system substrate-binding protein